MFNKKPVLPEGLLQDLAAYIAFYYEDICQEATCAQVAPVQKQLAEEALPLQEEKKLCTYATESAPAPSNIPGFIENRSN